MKRFTWMCRLAKEKVLFQSKGLAYFKSEGLNSKFISFDPQLLLENVSFDCLNHSVKYFYSHETKHHSE